MCRAPVTEIDLVWRDWMEALRPLLVKLGGRCKVLWRRGEQEEEEVVRWCGGVVKRPTR